MKYPIRKSNKDLKFLDLSYNNILKGSRTKRIVKDKNGNFAIFKYEMDAYNEVCSEKLSYEIAKVLGYECARIELAIDDDCKVGVLNYLFIDLLNNNEQHIDAVSYLNIYNQRREEYYKLSNIKIRLDNLNKDFFNSFIKILVFDALVGERDRHEENWGIISKNNKSEIAPLYDNGCNLLREFKNEKFANKFYDGIKDFDKYILRSKTAIYKENSKKRYKHFELINYLNEHYHSDTQKELKNLKKLTDDKIVEIVDMLPDSIITEKHKEYIIKYLLKRRDILISMIEN